MATIAPWHSRGGDVYHIRDDCGMGNTITPESQIPGTASRRVCIDCLVLLLREMARY